MKILFLDVDGVLNSQAFFSARNKRTSPSPRNDIDSDALRRLCETIKRVGCLVVVSSSWRTGEPHRSAVADALAEHGVAVHGYTGTESYRRGLIVRGVEVQAWLDENTDGADYVIVDDDSDFLPHQMNRFVHTCQSVGLTDEKCAEIEDRFRNQEAERRKA